MTPDIPGGILRHSTGGTATFVGRPLSVDDLDAVITLHHAVRQAVSPDLLCFESDTFFGSHIDRCGRILGLFVEDRLIAYGVLGLPGPIDPNFGDDLALSPAEKAKVAHIDGSCVAPEWRGNGLQRLLIGCRLRWAFAAGRPIALTTVAPGNLPSLSNALAEGLTIRAVLPKYGALRYSLRRDLDRQPTPPPRIGRWIAIEDLPAQETAFKRAEIGWALSPGKAYPRIWFAALPPT
ncbi:MAG TPA: GNAT family N-acetyltransferase [Telmatospirillum sp.]|nr:GNAT family N-acetyltransferase [Telmatospirillum sp.]